MKLQREIHGVSVPVPPTDKDGRLAVRGRLLGGIASSMLELEELKPVDGRNR